MNILNNSIVKILPLVPRGIVRKFANKYIAGDVLADAVDKAKKLNDMGIMGTMDVLGENTTNEQEAEQASRECIEVLEAIDKNKLDSNLSIKLTQFGLNLDMDLCFENVSKVLDVSKGFKQFVRIDMEDSSVTSKTIEMFERARSYYPNCGIAVQAYLRRTYNDAEKLVKSHTNFRLCKGIYVEPEKIAYKHTNEIHYSYLKSLRLMLSNGSYVGIATHNDQLINGAYQMLDELKKKKDEYEFQMLLGVRENLRDKILKDGHRIRVYIPFGKHWYNYSIRRFKENPQMAGYIFKSLFSNN